MKIVTFVKDIAVKIPTGCTPDNISFVTGILLLKNCGRAFDDAGMTGVAGLVIYSVMMDINRSADYVFGWSHTLTSAGLSTAFLVVILMAVTNRVSLPVPQVQPGHRLK